MTRPISLFLVAFGFVLACAAVAAPPEERDLRIARSRKTGLATFVSMPDGRAIPVDPNVAAPSATEFLREYGPLFGVRDVPAQLKQTAVARDTLGRTRTSFEQVHEGVRVFGGRLHTHQNPNGGFVAANGRFFPVSPKLSVRPTVDRDSLEAIVRTAMGFQPTFDLVQLVIVDPGWYGDRPQGERLAYYVRASDWNAAVARAYFIDAHSGRILDDWNLVESARNRRIHDGQGGSAVPGPLARQEGQGPDNDDEVNRLYDYAGDTYDYYWRAFGRDSIDDNGAAMIATANSSAPGCPNAFFNGTQTVYCTGLSHDDIVGHEFTHAVVQYTADLIYQNQPGQLNESYADVFGELIDLFNGNVSLPGPPAPPSWPAHPSGPNVDSINELRTECNGGVRLQVDSPSSIAGNYPAGPALFGLPLDLAGVSGELAAANPSSACNGTQSALNGKIALIDRGACPFDLKVLNAQDSGALAVIIANNREGSLPFLSGSDPNVSIPSVGISQADGNMLRTAMNSGPVMVTLAANETSNVRWLVSEDGFGNQFRDMWLPSCLGDPDSANHPFQTCSPQDNGGVHSGSGVPNHAFSLVTDGGTFRGYEVDGIGPIKSGAVWYRALTTYLTEISDFEDLYAALNQSAQDLMGTFPLDPRTGFPSGSEFSANDATQLDQALLAVEMNTPGLCGSFESVLDPDPFDACDAPVTMYDDDFENGAFDWEVENSGPPTPYNWILRNGLPWGMPGAGWFVADPEIGNCQTSGEAGLHTLSSPILFIWDEAADVYLKFTHLVATEPAFDGGNLKVSVNFGPFELIPQDAFSYNPYNAAIAEPSENPLAGEPVFTGRGALWGTSFINLSRFAKGGDLIQFRFDFGKDQCGGHDGWYISDIAMFYCVPDGDGDFDHDDRVTLADVAHFQRCMLQSVRDGGPCAPGDLDNNGFISIRDFGPMIELLDDP